MLRKNVLSIFYSLLCSISLSLFLQFSNLLPSNAWYGGLALLVPLAVILNLVFAWQSSSESFSQLLLAGIVIKMLLALSLLLIYRFWDPADFLSFSLHFICQYILFTIFEIRYLLFIIQTRDHAGNI